MVFPGDILTKRLRLVVITPELMSMEPSVLRHLLHVDVPQAGLRRTGSRTSSTS